MGLLQKLFKVGRMPKDIQAEISDTDLERFPIREMSIPVDPQKVVRLFGRLKKLPPPGMEPSDKT
ncbi:MAG: hypothetical protein M3290_07175 [Actinomycetota bacterium]|nr:hypothetical protein [Actinomycetota bacterium]